MAKKNTTPDMKTLTVMRMKRSEACAEKVRLLFAQTVNEILALNKTMPILDEGVMFSFDGQNIAKQKKVEALLRRLRTMATMAIQQGISVEWEQANQECDRLISSVFGKRVLESPEFSAWTSRNTAARDAFINRAENGLKLSDRVWKSVQQLRDEMEVAMTVSIGEGESASSMSRKVREYLNDPDLMFRRFRYKKGEKDIIDPETGEVIGKEPVYGLKWKKRVKTPDGRYKFIDYDRNSYPSGTGVYKSSAKNAMRVARTETNIAYRRADNARWQQMDFVLGQRVQLSKNHPKKDICDKLQGDYPKDFVFDGWHPQCFCFCTPILMDESEMAKMTEAFLKGETYTPKGKQITDYPAAFKDWVREHSDDIAKARERCSEPYFIRNNALAVDEIINPQPKELSIAEKAKLRHEARTPEQEDAIRNAWEERKHKHQLIKKTASNVLKVAQDYGEVDFSELQAAIDAGDLTKMQTITKTVAQKVSAMKKQEAALADLIPDAHDWHKQFSMSELQSAHSAIEAGMNKLVGKTLAEQKKWLENEMKYVEDPTFLKPHSTYPTWKIAQDAYAKKLEDVVYQIDVNQVKSQLAIVETWSAAHPKSINVANFLAEAKLAIANNESIYFIKQKAQIAINEHQKRLAEQARRDAKKMKSVPTSFDADDYTQKAKDKAIWCKTARQSHQNWDADSETVWNSATTGEQEAWRAYTGGSGHMNRPLRGYDYTVSGSYNKWDKRNFVGVGNVNLDVESGEQHIRDLYSLCEKARFDTNRWLQRGIETWDGVEGFFGIKGLTRAQLRGMVGQEVCDYAFMSCGSAKGTGFSGLILNIYCPKGTKGFYACPHSYFGDHENETILQAGTRFRILKVEAPDHGNCYVDIEVIGYTQHPSLK